MRLSIALITVMVLTAFIGCDLVRPARIEPSPVSTLLLWAPDRFSVQVLGDWNGWGGLTDPPGRVDQTKGLMTREEGGFWRIELDLPRGVYRYAFYLDGTEMVADPANPSTESFMGHEVSVLVIE